MINNKRIIAIIPARGGSKGIPNKNIINFNGKPLIAYSIEAALESKYIDDLIVSTESGAIREVALKYNAKVPFLRPIELSTDTAKTIDSVVYTLDTLKLQGYDYEYVVLLQPTQPLRQSFHIDEAIEIIEEKNVDSLVSVSIVIDHPVLIRTIEDNELKPILDSNSTIRRQDFKTYYKVNGSIYINKINKDFNTLTSLNDNKYPYIMNKKYDIDIDEPFDLKVASLKLNELFKGVTE